MSNEKQYAYSELNGQEQKWVDSITKIEKVEKFKNYVNPNDEEVKEYQNRKEEWQKLRVAGENAELLFQQGIKKQQAGNLNGALEDLDQAVKLNPHFARAFNQSGLVYMAVADAYAEHECFEFAGVQDNFAIVSFQNAGKYNPEHTEAFRNIEKIFEKYQNTDPNTEKFLEANSRKIQNSQIAVARVMVASGALHQMRECIDGALWAYAEALKLNQHYAAEIYLRRAELYIGLSSKETDEESKKSKVFLALADYDNLISLHPGDSVPLIRKGKICETLLKDNAQAVECYQRAMQLVGNKKYESLQSKVNALHSSLNMDEQTKVVNNFLLFAEAAEKKKNYSVAVCNYRDALCLDANCLAGEESKRKNFVTAVNIAAKDCADMGQLEIATVVYDFGLSYMPGEQSLMEGKRASEELAKKNQQQPNSTEGHTWQDRTKVGHSRSV